MAASYIWHDRDGEGRNLHSMFRRSFKISGTVKKAELNLFADSVYELYVNGTYVDFGPVRFDPRAPQYDIYDLTPHLCEGCNTIAVLVRHFGCVVFRAMPARAGMIAWGSVETVDGETVSLESGTSWKIQRSDAYRPTAPKMSFSLEPMEIFSQAMEPAGWRGVDFDDSGWADAMGLEKQDAWGDLSPRSIPFMSGKEVRVDRVTHIGPLLCDEDIYSFQVPALYWYDFHFSVACRKEFSATLFYTWIYSPEEQTVPAGLFWGEHWLNGELLNSGKGSANSSMRVDHSLQLKQGWNSFFGKIDAYFESIDFYLGLPSDRELVVNADRDLNGNVIFRRTDVLRTEEYEALGGEAALPFAADSLPSVSCGWIGVTANDPADNPARERDWDRFGEDLPVVSPDELRGFVFRKEEFPDGFVVELDMGAMRLLRQEIDLEGVAGATVDFAFSEHFHDGERAKLFPTHEYYGAARAKCSRDRLVWSPMQPHGFRYFVLTVRNPSGDVKLNRLAFHSAEYPVEEVGAFDCSDSLLNDIWAMCKRTEMTDMEDAYIDCPGRERGMYVRDTIIQYHNNLALFGDHKLMRHCLDLYGMSSAPDGKFRACYPLEQDYTIADFSLNMVEGFSNYVQQTGDFSVVENCWDAIKTNLQWFHDLSDEREDGFLDADWPAKHGKESRYMGLHGDNQSVSPRDGVNSVFTSMYLSALLAAAQLADQLNDATTATDCRRRYEKVKASVNRLCWNAEQGSYADTLEKKQYTIQAAIMAFRAGVPDVEQTDALRTFILKNLPSLFADGVSPAGGVIVSPHFCFYLFEVLYSLGLAELAEKLMREGWSWMMTLGTKTCTEFFSPKGSWCHAWSASPAYYLSKNALGVQIPDWPNQDHVEIRVQSSLESATGTWPHPKGPLYVQWHMEDGKRIFDRVEAPEGVTVTICG